MATAYEQVEVGMSLPRISKEPTTQQLVKYAGASGDFYQIHYDKDFAQASGLPGVIIHGLLKAGWLAELVTAWAGPDAFVRKIAASYRGIDVPGQPYVLTGRVTGKRTEEGRGLVDLELWGENRDGQRTTLGSATVDLPLRR
jgi:acyl dehydratase